MYADGDVDVVLVMVNRESEIEIRVVRSDSRLYYFSSVTLGVEGAKCMNELIGVMCV